MTRGLYLVVLLALATFYYYFLGAGPTPSEIEELQWWRPRGWALRWESMAALKAMTEEEGSIRLLPTLLFALPPIALIWAGFRLFQSALMRVGVLGIGLTLIAFAYYGFLVQGVWRFFSWRWPAVTLSMSLLTASLILAPALVRWAAGLRLPGRILAFLVPAVTFYLISVEVTGTNWSLRANFSPWPVLTMFGLLVFGYIAVSVHAATGAGTWIAARFGGSRILRVGVLASAVLAAILTPLAFGMPSFSVDSGDLTALVAEIRAYAVLMGLLFVAGAIAGAILLRRAGDAEDVAARAKISLAAAAILFGLIWLSDAAAGRDFEVARNEVAPEIIEALEAYYAATEEYPDELEDLVPDYLAAIPNPEIGVIRHEGEVFLYINLGTSFNLEFAAGKWVQCAYSPAYSSAWGDDPNGEEMEVAEVETDETPDVGAAPDADGDEEEYLEGSWSCEPALPSLW